MCINEWLLRAALEECTNLINMTFLFKFDYKGIHKEKVLMFLKRSFYHLLGFGKLTGLSFLSDPHSNKSMLFQEICNNDEYIKAIANAVNFCDIEGKLLATLRFKDNLLSNNISMFEFVKIEHSNFNCDWLLKCKCNEDCMFYGLVNHKNILLPNSAFTENNKDYSKNSKEVDSIKIESIDPVLIKS